MISKLQTNEDPVLSRNDAIEILNTPDEQLDELIARAEVLRRKYKGNDFVNENHLSRHCSGSVLKYVVVESSAWVRVRKML